MDDEFSEYGLWPVAVVNALIFILFAFSFTRPRSGRDWRSFGTFSAFIAALFAEMYGFPLTIYLLAGWLTSRNPTVDVFAHNSGHLWETLFGWAGDPHTNPLHLVSDGLTIGGLLLLGAAWKVLYQAQKRGDVAHTGLYAWVRHPQYVLFIGIMLGFLLQWPTLPTLILFPVLVTMYVRLARREEREALARFGERYARYKAVTPGFVPRWSQIGTALRSATRAPANETHQDGLRAE